MADVLDEHAEARPVRRAGGVFRVALFLVFMPLGALVWRILLAPVWRALVAGWRPWGDGTGPGAAMGRAMAADSPAILLTLAALAGLVAWGRVPADRVRPVSGAAALIWMGVALALAGLMQAVGRPALLGWLQTGGPVWRAEVDPMALALIGLGVAIALLARLARED